MYRKALNGFAPGGVTRDLPSIPNKQARPARYNRPHTMPLTPGTRLGPYEILAPIGKGGMGEVYRAHDSRLNRTVAIKICGKEFSARFQREARAIAALNHPHVCTLYDIGPDYLVMEYIEGKVLQGPVPIERVVEYASQICDALDAAHRKGIIHRDLKPSNILVTRSGVKVLDFGLAKVGGPDETLTQPGVVMGTPAYMAPEQLAGEESDALSDIYSLGCVIHEMATGQRVMHNALRPAALDRVVKTCLEADPEERWQSAREVKLALELVRPAGRAQQADVVAGARRPRWRTLAPWCAAALMAILAVVGLVSRRPAQVPDAPAMSTLVSIPPEHQLVEGATPVPFDVSADGTKLVYLAREGGRPKLFLRPLGQFAVKPLPGTEYASSPFFSPDGRWVGFFTQSRLFKVAADGSSPVLIADVEQNGNGAWWSKDDTIIYGSDSGLMTIPAGGGKPSRLTALAAGEVRHGLPRLIPDTSMVLFTVNNAGSGNDGRIAIASLQDGKHRILMEGAQGAYVSSRLVYATYDVLRAAPFDLVGLRLAGSPVTLLDDVYTGQGNGRTYYRITASGMLVYVPGRNEHSLVRVDRAGRSTPLTARRAGYRMPRLSKDGRSIAVVIDPPDEGNSDIWILDLHRGAFSKVTREGHNLGPVFTPDGRRIAWANWKRGPKAYWRLVEGSGEPEPLGSLQVALPWDFSSDGKYSVQIVPGPPRWAVWVLPLDPDRKPFPLVGSTYSTIEPRFSPDGKWLVYTSDESGRREVYVRRFPRSEGHWIVSTDGGALPVWSRDSKEIFYMEGRRMMAVSVQADAAFSAGKPALLFDRPDLTMAYPAFDVMGDDFLMVERDPLSMLTEFRVVQNWVRQEK
jgi:Tol biopolymer transport system component/predicted Ser/Thr protein kinase